MGPEGMGASGVDDLEIVLKLSDSCKAVRLPLVELELVAQRHVVVIGVKGCRCLMAYKGELYAASLQPVALDVDDGLTDAQRADLGRKGGRVFGEEHLAVDENGVGQEVSRGWLRDPDRGARMLDGGAPVLGAA